MDRRDFLKLSAAGAASLTVSSQQALGQTAPARAAAAATAGNRPNILFMLSDDHSTPFLSCYGDTNLKTPNLDRLASEGLLCDRQFVCCPQCVPSRASLMTGRSPVAARMTRFTSPLPRDEITLPEVLREKAGYFTGVCGRNYHLDGSGRNAPVTDRVFAKYKLLTFGARLDFAETRAPAENPVRFGAFLDKVPAGRPFFFWANYSDPHHIWNAKEFEPDPASLKLPPYLPDLPGVREDLAKYYGEVMRVDRDARLLLDVLDQRGLADKTLVVFMGDNGYALPHGKGSLYDPGLNTPLIVRWPGVVAPGRRSSALISGEDLAPTLLEAAGAPVPERMSGVSYLKLLRGEKFEERRAIFGERGPHGKTTLTPTTESCDVDFGRCVRTARHKLIYNCTPWIPYSPVDSMADPSWQQIKAAQKAGKLAPPISRTYFSNPRPIYELYDLEKDPGELDNLAGKPEYAALEQELKEALQEKMILDYDYLPLPISPE